MAKTPDLTGFAIPRKGEATPATQPTEQAPPADVLTTVSTRLPLSVQERLRRYAFEAKRDKQGVIAEALAEFLKAKGF
jgi:hypothetical protein